MPLVGRGRELRPISLPRRRRKPVHGGSDETSLFHTHQLFCGSEHPLFKKDSADLQKRELADWEMVRPKFRQAEVLPKRFRQSPKMTSTGFNIEGIAMLVLAGRFLGFLPVNFAEHWVQLGQMRALWPNDIEAKVEIALVRKKSGPYAPHVQAFIDDVLAVHAIKN